MTNTKVISTMRSMLRKFGYDIIRYNEINNVNWFYPSDFDKQKKEICECIKPYTMTSLARVNALIDAVRYIENKSINGAMVECGVWKGGSSMAIAMALKGLGSENRDLYLYDTYSGMTMPTDEDISYDGITADEQLKKTSKNDENSVWCISNIEEVKDNLYRTNYNKNKIHFIEGKVEETIPGNIPNEIALLRIDTDWYESTKHELMYLFPLLKKNGVIIIDDYGHWQGTKKAVDEYFIENNIKILLNRIDYTGRIGVKV